MKSIAIIGATPDRDKYANKAIRAYLKKGYKVIPVNPKYEEIEGLKTERIEDIHTDTISVYLRPDVFSVLIPKLPKEVKTAYLNPGTQRDDVIQSLKDRGIEPLMLCSIVAVGLSPDSL